MPQILIVDDDPAIQLLLQRTLLQQGYDIILANNGNEGLSKAKELGPAMIICDWLMPGLSGIEVCRQIKAIPELSTTFFILLTSLGSVEDRIKGLDAGADDFLCKPVEMNELKARVRAGLRLHQLSRDLQEQKELLESELAEAADYVRSILPEPIQESQISIDFRFIPSRQLGGDSFDYYWLDQDHLVIYLIDVSGHGLRASLPSLSVINLLRSKGLPNVNYYRPSEVLRGLNEAFQMTQRNDKYFTIWYGVFSTRKRSLIYSSAGHPPAMLFSPQKEIKTLKTFGFPVGMFPDADYVDDCCSVTPLSSLYIFSDGIYEINLSNEIVWGLELFLSELKEYHKTPKRNLEQLLARIPLAQSIEEELNDDLSIIQIDFS
ncbi:MAG: PP2C family protein-serine/threonine phosphatase [Chroococcales cyanobacterium]